MPKPSSKTVSSSSSPVRRAPDEIVVTTQQSRFHADAADAPESKEVDIKDVTLSIGERELLSSAHLRIQEGVHYVFVGRNGTGKSTLLKALAERKVPGVPENLRILLLGQTRIDSLDVGGPSPWKDESGSTGKVPQSVLQYVVTSDRRREQYIRQEKLLSKAIEGNADSEGGAQIVRKLIIERLEHELSELRLIAARRSGARGLKARQAVTSKEEELEEAQTRLERQTSQSNDADLKSGLDMLEQVRLDLASMDAGRTESIARTILLGLGFSETQFEKPLTSLSGGWRTRCELASALIQSTDILLLDEPTNFLDLPAIIWLQHYITNTLQDVSVIVVTHDRAFADAVAEQLLLLRIEPARTLETFDGTLTDYEREKRRQIRHLTRMKDANDRKKEKMGEAIQASMKTARKTGDDKRMKQAISKKKKLEERMGVEVSAKGGRFKLSRDRTGWNASTRADIEIPELDPDVKITLPDQPEKLRFPGPLVSFEDVTFSYTNSTQPVLKDITLTIHAGDRYALVGPNGCGKSTLVKLLLAAANGETNPAPSKGTIKTHPRAKIACYTQHAVEQLEALGKQNPSMTALSYLSSISNPSNATGIATTSTLSNLSQTPLNTEHRVLLAKFGLQGSFASSTPLAALSGGQRVRLALAETMMHSPHLLVLDEVTTHLDSDTIVALTRALRSWQGALLVVSHDRGFIRGVVQREKFGKADRDGDDGESSNDSSTDDEDAEGGEGRAPGRVYRILKAGTLKFLEGGMGQYEDFVEKQVAKLGLLGT